MGVVVGVALGYTVGMDVGLVVGAAVLQHSAPSAVRYFSPGLVAPAGHQAFERVHDVNGKPAGTSTI